MMVANLIGGGCVGKRNIGDGGRGRSNSGGRGTVHHGNFFQRGGGETRGAGQDEVRREGRRRDVMVTMAM